MSNDSPLVADPRFALLQEILPPACGHDPLSSLEMKEGSDAAVAIILRARPELELLLIQRAEAEADPWSGHMALPGGRRDPGDDTLLQTAMRETLEETGLDLQDEGLALGRIKELAPSPRRLPLVAIHPFVFGVGKRTEARVASPEVVETLWTPLAPLQDPGASETVAIDIDQTTREFPCFRVEGKVVWGLTYRILTRFLEMAPDLPPTLR